MLGLLKIFSRFEWKVRLAYCSAFVLCIGIAAVSVYLHRISGNTLNRMTENYVVMMQNAEQLRFAFESLLANKRALLLTGKQEPYRRELDEARLHYLATTQAMRAALKNPDNLALLDKIEKKEAVHYEATVRLLHQRNQVGLTPAVVNAFTSELDPLARELGVLQLQLTDAVTETFFNSRTKTAETVSETMQGLLFSIVSVAIIIALIGIAANRTLRLRQADHEKLERAVKELQESKTQLRLANAMGVKVQEKERSRLSRELHDELGQSLTALKLEICEVARNLAPEHKDAADKINRLAANVGPIMQSIRKLASDLRPALLEDLGIGPALELLADTMAASSGAQCMLDINVSTTKSHPQISYAVYRIVQEALTNAVRHGPAEKIDVSLSESEDGVELDVRDYQRRKSSTKVPIKPGLGILGMRERAEQLGGVFSIKPFQEGIHVSVRIPFPAGGMT